MGWGGARKGAGRKSRRKAEAAHEPPNQPAAPTGELSPETFGAIATMTPEEIMETGMRLLAARGFWGDAAKVAKALAQVRNQAAKSSPPGKKQTADDAAQERIGAGGRFAPRPPPGRTVN